MLRFAYLLSALLLVLLSAEASIESNNLMKSSTLLGSRNVERDTSFKPWRSVNRISKEFQNQAQTLKEGFLRQVRQESNCIVVNECTDDVPFSSFQSNFFIFHYLEIRIKKNFLRKSSW